MRTIESAIVVPLILLFLAFLIIFNVKVFKISMQAVSNETAVCSDYVDMHRKTGAVFEGVEDLYERLFGE